MKQHTSISHFSGREQQALLRLKNRIVALYQPLIIYLIGYNCSNGLIRNCFANSGKDSQWHFSCDLLLVLPNGSSLPDNAAEELKNTSNDYEHIHLIAHPFDFVAKQLQEYSLFFCWIQRRATTLYERDRSIGKLPEPVENMKQYEGQVHQYFAHNPHYENYPEVKLSPFPTIPLNPCKEKFADSDESIESFKAFLQHHNPKAVNRNLKQILYHFMKLIELLDVAEDESIIQT